MTPEEIVDQAIALIESNGVEALSMRKLAAELGVAPTTIYWHVGDRDAVLDAVVERVLAERAAIHPTGRTPAARIASIARQLRRQIADRPALTQLVNARGRGPAASFPSQVAIAREVTAAGLTGAEAAGAVWAILHLVGGSMLLAAALSHAGGRTGTTAALWAELDDPAIEAGLAAHMADRPSAEEVFEHQLAALLRGLLP